MGGMRAIVALKHELRDERIVIGAERRQPPQADEAKVVADEAMIDGDGKYWQERGPRGEIGASPSGVPETSCGQPVGVIRRERREVEVADDDEWAFYARPLGSEQSELPVALGGPFGCS